MSNEILSFSVAELLEGYRKKTVSPVDAALASLGQVEKYNPQFNAMALVAEKDFLLEQAKASEERWNRGTPQGPLDGVPVTIKDGANVAGWPTREGSFTMPSTPQAEDSPSVARLREAGAVFVGKTTLPEYGHKGVTDSPVTGVTRNPWNPAKTCGGSSGGAAVAAAARMGYLHHGTDGGGSIRIPSNFCGVFGIKPTSGLVPGWPPTLFSTIASAGPITRGVEDAALMLDVMSLPDARDWHSVPYQKQDYAQALRKPVSGLKIAYARTISGVPVHPETARLVEEGVKKMQGIGHVEEITLDLPTLVTTFNRHWMAIAAWLVGLMPEGKRPKMDPYLLDWARRGREMALDDYLNAEHERMMLGHRMKMLFEKYDVLVMPVTPMPAFDTGLNVAPGLDGKPMDDWTPFTFPANLCKLPASSVPCGVTKDGLPVGMQVVAGYLQEKLVLQVSHAFEQALGFRDWLDRNTDVPQKQAACS